MDFLRDVYMSKPPKIPVTLVGGAARRALATDCRGRVLAVYRRSFYLEMFSGALACLGSSSIEPGPLVARCEIPDAVDWMKIGLRVDARVHIENELLAVDGRYLFDMRRAEEWASPGFPSTRGFSNLSRGIAALRKKALKDAPGGGLGFLIPFLLGQSVKSAEKNEIGDFFARHARIGIGGMRAWLETELSRKGPKGHPPAEVEKLLGLGIGLTPSGDDFLGGAMIALHALGRGASAGRLAAWTLPRARSRTSRISCAHLSCAAEGEGAEALHDTLSALVQSEDDRLDRSLSRLGAIGHTSGWDALAGAALVFQEKAGF